MVFVHCFKGATQIKSPKMKIHHIIHGALKGFQFTLMVCITALKLHFFLSLNGKHFLYINLWTRQRFVDYILNSRKSQEPFRQLGANSDDKATNSQGDFVFQAQVTADFNLHWPTKFHTCLSCNKNAEFLKKAKFCAMGIGVNHVKQSWLDYLGCRNSCECTIICWSVSKRFIVGRTSSSLAGCLSRLHKENTMLGTKSHHYENFNNNRVE